MTLEGNGKVKVCKDCGRDETEVEFTKGKGLCKSCRAIAMRFNYYTDEERRQYHLKYSKKQWADGKRKRRKKEEEYEEKYYKGF